MSVYHPTFKVIVHREPKPIPTMACDWEAFVDGEEEQTSITAPTCYDALRDLADRLEEIDYQRDDPEAPWAYQDDLAHGQMERATHGTAGNC